MRESHDRISSQFQPGRAGTKGHFGAGDRPQGVGARLRRGAHPVFRDHADDGSERLQPQSVRHIQAGVTDGSYAAAFRCADCMPSGRSWIWQINSAINWTWWDFAPPPPVRAVSERRCSPGSSTAPIRRPSRGGVARSCALSSTSSLGRPVGGTAALLLQCGPDARLQPDSVVRDWASAPGRAGRARWPEVDGEGEAFVV